MNKKVCILTSVHTAKDVRIYEKEAVSLRKAGYDIVILNKELDGSDEYGIVFKRVSIPEGRIGRFFQAPKRMYRAAIGEKADIYHFHDPELLTCGRKLLKHGSVIYDSHEDVPQQILSKYWINPVFRKCISFVFNIKEKNISKKLTAVITATQKIAESFVKSGCKRVYTIHNYPLLSEFSSEQEDWNNKENRVCYVGGLSIIRGITEMVTAIEKCGCRLAVAGTFDNDELKQKTEALDGWNKVDYFSQVGRTEIAQILSKSKAGLVTIHPVPNYMESLPIKMFEYMAAGIPVIASDFPYWKAILHDGNCGVNVNPLDPDSIADAINEVLSDKEKARAMGENGRRLVLSNYNWAIEEKELLNIYSGL